MKPVIPHPPLSKYYDDPSRREEYVREIFDETAPWYDWAVRFMSFGSGHWYRREALKRAGLKPGMRLLDLATGTGVVARAAEEITNDIVGVDPSIGMLVSGVMQSPKVQGAAERIPVRASSFDAVSIGFALRHFADLRGAFEECHRALRPGGRILILEITAPERRIPRALLGLYMGTIVPAAMRIRSRNARAAEMLRYYWDTTRDCVRPDVIMDALRAAGFTDVKRRVEMGIFSEYSGSRAASPPDA
ncbi:MAG TPA: class I SAM-dependent methyltransferase [Thermoanaerobaculia bacterium]|nr:class I SAM-dependent methyltransferase [Thermoanaerobaculia bacterium]